VGGRSSRRGGRGPRGFVPSRCLLVPPERVVNLARLRRLPDEPISQGLSVCTPAPGGATSASYQGASAQNILWAKSTPAIGLERSAARRFRRPRRCRAGRHYVRPPPGDRGCSGQGVLGRSIGTFGDAPWGRLVQRRLRREVPTSSV
jgi:hypothetical protein